METTIIEAPETPAPVFAFRAFRNAIFGTPQTVAKQLPVIDDASKNQALSVSETHTQIDVQVTEATGDRRQILDLSPTKRQGILLTPGTAGGRRKTVTFGEGTQDRREKDSRQTTRSGLPNTYPGKFPSPWTPKVELVGSRRNPTALTRSFMHVRDQQEGNEFQKVNPLEDLLNWEDIEDDKPESKGHQTTEADVTIDLNKPQSGSGRHWKSKYDRHHQQSKQEIHKLIQYKSLAKSYAKKKDLDAAELEDKLREEKAKVAVMEKDLAELARLVAVAKGTGTSSEEDQERFVSELAQQTARMLKSQKRLDQYEEAMGKAQPKKRNRSLVHTSNDPETLNILELSAELKQLRLDYREARRKATTLEEIRIALSKDLSIAHRDLEKYEQRRIRQEERFQAQIKRLEDQIVRQKQKNEEALSEKRNLQDTVQSQKKEIDDLKRQISQISTTAKDRNEDLRGSFRQSSQWRLTEARKHKRDATSDCEKRIQTMLIDAAMPISRRQHSKSPVALRTESLDRGVKTQQTVTIGENYDFEASLPSPNSSIGDWSISHGHDNANTKAAPIPQQQRLRAASLDLTNQALPSPENFSQSGFLSNCALGPISNSPKFSTSIRSGSDTRRRDQILEESADINRRSIAEGTGSGGRSKKQLPPDRAAAAKARLQQRRIEKNRQLGTSLDADKENVR